MNIHHIDIAQDPSAIDVCYQIFKILRPHLQEPNQFREAVLRQMQQGYRIAYIKGQTDVVACMGFRMFDMLAWGKILYIDDLITQESERGKGYGSALLSHAVSEANRLGCQGVHLDTGYTRHAAHRAYLKHGFEFNCHHLILNLTPQIV